MFMLCDGFLLMKKLGGNLLKNILLALIIAGTSCTIHSSSMEYKVALDVKKDSDLSFTQSRGYGKLGPATMGRTDNKNIPINLSGGGGIDGGTTDFDFGTPEQPSYLRFDVYASEDFKSFQISDLSHNPHAGDVREIMMSKIGNEWNAMAGVYNHTDACGGGCNDNNPCSDYYDILDGGKIIIGSLPTRENPTADFRVKIHLYSPEGEMVLEVVTDRVMNRNHDQYQLASDARYSPDGEYVYFRRDMVDGGIYRVPANAGKSETFVADEPYPGPEYLSPAPAIDGSIFCFSQRDLDYNSDSWSLYQLDENGGFLDDYYLGNFTGSTWNSLRTHPNSVTMAFERDMSRYAWDIAVGDVGYSAEYGCEDDYYYYYKASAAVVGKGLGDKYVSQFGEFAGYDLMSFQYPVGVSDDGSWLMWDFPDCEGDECCTDPNTDIHCGLSAKQLSPKALHVIIDGEGRWRETDLHRPLLRIDYENEWRVRPISPAFISNGFAYFLAVDGRPPHGNLPEEGCLPLKPPSMADWCKSTNREHVLDARPVLARANLDTGEIESLTALAAYFLLLDISPDGSKLLIYGDSKSTTGPSDNVSSMWNYDIETGTFTSILSEHSHLQPWFDQYRNSVSPCYW
jgi:hypothetical protein